MPREDLIIKHEREVLSNRSTVLSLERRYKRVIDELRKQRDWWRKNAWKSVFVNLTNKLKRKEMK